MGVGTSLCSCLFASVWFAFLFLGPLLDWAGLFFGSPYAPLFLLRFQPQITDRIEMDADWNPVLKKRGISVLLAAPAAYSSGR